MASASIMGTITFINYDKGYATIEYLLNEKKKTISGNISEKEQLKLKTEKIIKKVHHFHVGDQVSFIIQPSARGDKMVADCIEFKFNNAIDSLVNKSATENRFVGYLKKAGDDYFVKETGSYVFFPLKLSPWERKPSDEKLNEPFFFQLEHTKGGKSSAVSFKPIYIPDYNRAMRDFNSKTPVEASVYKITPHGIFVNIHGDRIQAKIPLVKEMDSSGTEPELKIGDTIKVMIRYLGSSRIVVERI